MMGYFYLWAGNRQAVGSFQQAVGSWLWQLALAVTQYQVSSILHPESQSQKRDVLFCYIHWLVLIFCPEMEKTHPFF